MYLPNRSTRKVLAVAIIKEPRVKSTAVNWMHHFLPNLKTETNKFLMPFKSLFFRTNPLFQ
jgi:hypothetical protein